MFIRGDFSLTASCELCSGPVLEYQKVDPCNCKEFVKQMDYSLKHVFGSFIHVTPETTRNYFLKLRNQAGTQLMECSGVKVTADEPP